MKPVYDARALEALGVGAAAEPTLIVRWAPTPKIRAIQPRSFSSLPGYAPSILAVAGGIMRPHHRPTCDDRRGFQESHMMACLLAIHANFTWEIIYTRATLRVPGCEWWMR